MAFFIDCLQASSPQSIADGASASLVFPFWQNTVLNQEFISYNLKSELKVKSQKLSLAVTK